ncbi:MAG: hypothetical protein U0T74_14050 [Chitinophagales bacterium]
MKRVIVTTMFCFGLNFLFAQQITDLYKFNSQVDAERVSTILKNELKLSSDEFIAVSELLLVSAKSQIELSGKEQNKDAYEASTILRRQTQHIEANLQNIIGVERFKLYQSQKSAIEAKTKAGAKKN